MSTDSVPCTRYDRSGTDDPVLREVLRDAGVRAGRDLSPYLRALYTHNDELIATWRARPDRATWSEMLSAAWRDKVGESRILHLIPTDDDYDFQEDVVDNGADE